MPKKNLYDANCMGSAINDVKSHNISLRAAAKNYGVPKSILEFKLKNPGHKDTCGPSPILTLREESKLVTWIEELATRGFPRKKEDILNSVQQFLIENSRPNPFKPHRPGECWFKAFLRRYPTIVQRTSEAVSSASACVSEGDIRKWSSDIKGYLESKNIDLDDPSRIFNGDETGFHICPSTGKVFAAKGRKNVYAVDKGSQKESITVMYSYSATGMTCTPMVIFPYKRIPEKIALTVNTNWGIGRSDNGWMTSETFYDYIKNILYPHLIGNNVQFPVILFLDGHKSHLTYELSLLCNELNIEVIALYPNATIILWPCDVAVFRPIKIGWKKAVREFYEKNPGQVLNKMTFAPLLEKVVAEVVKPETLENGFRACGLFPFNPDAIDYSKCVTHAESVMDNKTFISFIGDEMISKFKSFDAILTKEEFNNEFLTLHQMWNYFGKPNKEEKAENNVQAVGIEMIESVEPDFELKESDIELERPDIELEVPSNSELKERNGTNSEKVHVIENIVIHRKDVTEFATLNDDTSLLCRDGNVHSLDVPQQVHASSICKNISNISSVTLISPLTSKACISAYLKVPDKPQRKNKRDVERVSFAITYRCFQESFEAKRAFKAEEENRKLERKRLREEKAATKSKSGIKKVRKPKEVINNGNCFLCKKRLIKSSHFYTCDNCKNHIHRLCIPNTHRKHVPDLEDDDILLCHICYREDSDDEADDEEDRNENEEKEECFEGSENGDRKHEENREIKEGEEEIDSCIIQHIHRRTC